MSNANLLREKIKLDYEWRNMSCKVCSSFQWNGNKPADKCDLLGKVSSFNYCPIFHPRASLTKQQILDMFSDHTQRWIRERIEYNL